MTLAHARSRHRMAGGAALVMALAAVVAYAHAKPPAVPPKPAANDTKCVLIHSEARYGAYAYDHLVDIENICDRGLNCSVKTDVNPEPTQVRVGPHEKVTVLTFRGSPAREFKPDVQCKQES